MTGGVRWVTEQSDQPQPAPGRDHPRCYYYMAIHPTLQHFNTSTHRIIDKFGFNSKYYEIDKIRLSGQPTQRSHTTRHHHQPTLSLLQCFTAPSLFYLIGCIESKLISQEQDQVLNIK